MSKTPSPYLADIVESIRLIEQYVNESGITKEQFLDDIRTQDAVVRRLEIIGEATKRLEKEFKEQYDKIPWRQMSGLRDVLIHDYDEVNLERVWLVIEKDLPLLSQQLHEIQSGESA